MHPCPLWDTLNCVNRPTSKCYFRCRFQKCFLMLKWKTLSTGWSASYSYPPLAAITALHNLGIRAVSLFKHWLDILLQASWRIAQRWFTLVGHFLRSSSSHSSSIGLRSGDWGGHSMTDMMPADCFLSKKDLHSLEVCLGSSLEVCLEVWYRPKPHFARGVSKLLEGSVLYTPLHLTIVTEPTRRAASGSKCKLLLINIVKSQAGSNNSKRVWHGQDTSEQ